jgi:dTDP-4-dehydrorhamnose 3,5-epimerase
MKIIPTPLAGAWVLEPEKMQDERGFFARAFCVKEMGEAGLETGVVQANVSFNHRKGTLRGLHFQKSPFEETKIVRCTRGAIFDVMVDLRPDSPTLGEWFGAELTEDNHRLLYIPKRFAHGFQTLRDDAEIMYMVTQFYTPSHASGLPWDDPAFGIAWPLEPTVMSTADRSWKPFTGSPFPGR